MNYIYFSLLLCITGLQALAQADGSVRGKLQDTVAHVPVPDATVTVLSSRDSSLAGFSRSTASGAFLVPRLSKGAYRLLISHIGFRSVSRNFVISDLDKDVNLGEIVLTDKSSMLDSVTVQQELICSL